MRRKCKIQTIRQNQYVNEFREGYILGFSSGSRFLADGTLKNIPVAIVEFNENGRRIIEPVEVNSCNIQLIDDLPF